MCPRHKSGLDKWEQPHLSDDRVKEVSRYTLHLKYPGSAQRQVEGILDGRMAEAKTGESLAISGSCVAFDGYDPVRP